MEKPKKWYEVYKTEEECKVFKSLARHPQYIWRSVDAISRETSLSKEIVEKILSKYHSKGIVLQNDSQKWAYWENIGEKEPAKSVDESDKEARIGWGGSPGQNSPNSPANTPVPHAP